MRVKFLFWNIRKGEGKRLADCISRLANQDVDVFLFAESHKDEGVVCAALNAQSSNQYSAVSSRSSRVRFFTRQNGPLMGCSWHDRYFSGVSDRITALECQPQGALSILVIGAHLDSAMNLSLRGRTEWARAVAKDIQTIEKDVGHDRTILVGDLNMNPFDDGVTETSALHAVMTRSLTNVVVRHTARANFPVFYNPMWSCLGDRPGTRIQPNGRRRTPGTYYYNNTDDRSNIFWQTFDHVLLRPSMMEKLTYLEILSGDGSEEFVTNEGKPRGELISDHLPIIFELNL